MIKVILLFSILSINVFANDEVVYSGKLKVSISESLFVYKDSFIKETITVKKCNQEILASVFDLFTLPRKISSYKKLTLNPNRVTFLRNKKEILVPKGSQIHRNLESINKKIQGFISRARIACKK